MDTCKNCGAQLQGAYCSRCGQKGNIQRLTFGHLMGEVFYFFTHIEKGFLFTSWKMTQASGQSINEYIAGRRIRYQKPFSFFLIWAGIYVLFLLLIEWGFGKDIVTYRGTYFGSVTSTEFATHYLSIALGVLVPIYGIFLYFICMRPQFNYIESLVAVLYGQGALLILQVAFILVAVVIYSITGVGINNNISDGVKLIYIFFFGYTLIAPYSISNKWLRVTAFTVLSLGTFIAWRLYAVPVLTRVFVL